MFIGTEGGSKSFERGRRGDACGSAEGGERGYEYIGDWGYNAC